jgi:NitT/TauT family transport system permease protein
MNRLLRILCSLSGLAALVGAWAAIHALYGPLVLPRPDLAARELLRLLVSGEAQPALAATLLHSLGGWAAGGLSGLLLALLAGFWRPAALALAPVATVLLGTPPIAWLLLAALWFGANGFDAGFTVAVVVAPIVFVAALQGFHDRDPDLDEMAAGFCAPKWLVFTDILAPQMLSHLLPAAATALGMALKVCVMSEVMASGTGIGGRLAAARANLDLTEALAWILLVVALVLTLDLVILAPVRRSLQASRTC